MAFIIVVSGAIVVCQRAVPFHETNHLPQPGIHVRESPYMIYRQVCTGYAVCAQGRHRWVCICVAVRSHKRNQSVTEGRGLTGDMHCVVQPRQPVLTQQQQSHRLLHVPCDRYISVVTPAPCHVAGARDRESATPWNSQHGA